MSDFWDRVSHAALLIFVLSFLPVFLAALWLCGEQQDLVIKVSLTVGALALTVAGLIAGIDP